VIEAHVWRLVDAVTIGIATFLVFGRLGCLSVACCHGRPAQRSGVVYRNEHVEVGLWHRWAHRPLIPVQLIEAAGTFGLVVVALVAAATPGTASLVLGVGYSTMRFFLEHARGDSARPFFYGISEAQWCCLAVAVLCVVARPMWITVSVLLMLSGAVTILVVRRVHRELELPQHLRELAELCATIEADAAHARRDTRLGVAVSLHSLPDGRYDWILSSKHIAWSYAMAKRVVGVLWPDAEVIAGRSLGVVHVIVDRLPN
jgi:hypothetical protein